MAPEHSSLHYISCEKHPIYKEDLIRIHKQWPELFKYSQALLACYLDHTPGLHRLHFKFDDKKIILDLHFGDVVKSLNSIYQPHGFRADAWYLDGFSPALNPAMWHSNLFKLIAKLSKAGTTLSTYSVAGHIRRNLSIAGFNVSKETGFAKKRHMLCATYTHTLTAANVSFPSWFIQAKQAAPQEKVVTVIGAGLAGCSTAYALANKGWQVNLIDREDKPASKASGNPQGIVYLKASVGNSNASQFQLAAYLFAIRQYQRLKTLFDLHWHQTGMILLANDSKVLEKQTKLVNKELYSKKVLTLLSSEEISRYANLPIKMSGVLLPETGWLNPNQLGQIYTQHPSITTYLKKDAIELNKIDKQWQVLTKSANKGQAITLNSDKVIIANSFDARNLTQSSHYPLIPNTGQIDFYESTPQSSKLQAILCTNAYIIPAADNLHSVGGSFTPNSIEDELSSEKSLKVLKQLASFLPDISKDFRTQTTNKSRAGIRCSTSDYLPIVGQVENVALNSKTYQELTLNAKQEIKEEATYEDGLFINIAHGSHGLSYTPLAAEYLASLIANEPLPCSNEVLSCLQPIRFLIRNLRKQKALPA